MDLQRLSDGGGYRFVLHCQDHLSKYSFLRPLTSKAAKRVVKILLPILIDVKAPIILQVFIKILINFNLIRF